jgi:hypothetical protein
VCSRTVLSLCCLLLQSLHRVRHQHVVQIHQLLAADVRKIEVGTTTPAPKCLAVVALLAGNTPCEHLLQLNNYDSRLHICPPA